MEYNYGDNIRFHDSEFYPVDAMPSSDRIAYYPNFNNVSFNIDGSMRNYAGKQETTDGE